MSAGKYYNSNTGKGPVPADHLKYVSMTHVRTAIGGGDKEHFGTIYHEEYYSWAEIMKKRIASCCLVGVGLLGCSGITALGLYALGLIK